MKKMDDTHAKEELLLCFSQGGMRFGAPASAIVEIMELPDLTPVPCEKEYLRGLFAYKGDLLPVLSFSRLCQAEDLREERTCIVLCGETGGRLAISISHGEDMRTAPMANREEGIPWGVLSMDSLISGGETILVLNVGRMLRDITII